MKWNLVAGTNGVFISENGAAFRKADGGTGKVRIDAVTQQGWALDKANNRIRANGEWYPLNSLVGTPAPEEVDILEMMDTGMAVAKIRKPSSSALTLALLLPVEFKTYPHDEAGPDKPHLRNLETRQNKEGFFGNRRKCVAHVWQDQWIDLIDYLAGADDPNLRELYEDNLDWRSNGQVVNHELNWVGEPPDDDITVYLIEVLANGGNDVIDSLYLTVIPRSTEQSFDDWHNAEKADTAWLQELPPVFNRIETIPESDGYLPRPDQNFNPYFYGVPKEINTRFHPDGYFEQRSYATPGGHGHQVCFDEGGVLLESGVSAGSADKAAPFPANLNPLPHVEADVKPFIWALQLDGNPTRQDGTNLTWPIMHEGIFAGRYLEVRPALPNDKPRLEPGATP